MRLVVGLRGGLSYVHVACTEYVTLMHVGGRTREDIDAGGVLGEYSGVLVRDGYAGYEHLTQVVHAWCGAHLLRDLRSISDADPQGQLWALAMANTLLDAHHTAHTARAAGADSLDPATLVRIRNLYRGALARGQSDNKGKRSQLATDARTLIRRFRRYEDMILRFATNLTVPFTNNTAERAVRPVKVQQRTSGGAWRTLQGLVDFAIVQSYLDTATKWASTNSTPSTNSSPPEPGYHQHSAQLNSYHLTCSGTGPHGEDCLCGWSWGSVHGWSG
jgi:transposase